LSTMIGTNGVLLPLKGYRKVGFQPQLADLVRALADVKLVGKDGYYRLYKDFSHAIDAVVAKMEGVGMKVIHGANRIRGSTVVAMEDPSGAIARKMKKKGYSTMCIYNVSPEHPERCLNGWQLSFTPHALRQVKDGDRTCLQAFLDDLLVVHASVQKNDTLARSQKYFKENSLASYLISGNTDLWVLGFLQNEGIGRSVAGMLIRRFVTAQLDSGTMCSLRRRNPIRELFNRTTWQALLVFICLLFVRRRRKAAVGILNRSSR